MTVLAMIEGKSPAFPVLVPPGPIIERDSTDLLCPDLPGVAEAIRFLRAHACAGINVGDVVEASGLSRASIDRHFREVLGCTPHEEIRRIQIARAKCLLITTHRDVATVASLSGFRDADYFTRVFRRQTGFTPTRYRSTHEARTGSAFLWDRPSIE
jgi:LacI family transcriptional regulator